MYSYNPYYYEYLAHHGVKGQKWGVRRYQPYTSANKGVFKNLKRSYKSSVRQIKKARKQYEKEGDELAVDAANKAIKDTKKAYKSELKGLKKDFKAENRAQYIQDVSERGNEKQVAQVRKEMSPDQLNYAVRRINAYKDWEKLSMRDVEKEVKTEQAMERLRKISQGAETVSKVALATTNVISAAKGFKELFKSKSSHERAMEAQQEEKARLDNEMLRQRIKSQEIANSSKTSSKTETKTAIPKVTETKVETKSEPKSSLIVDKGSSKSEKKSAGIFGENLIKTTNNKIEKKTLDKPVKDAEYMTAGEKTWNFNNKNLLGPKYGEQNLGGSKKVSGSNSFTTLAMTYANKAAVGKTLDSLEFTNTYKPKKKDEKWLY